ncbi:MAG: winged helix-turn-helix domain-containing protein [Desulfurococcaceae archaeon]
MGIYMCFSAKKRCAGFIIAVVATLLLSLYITGSNAQSVITDKITYVVFYDPMSNEGLMIIRFYVDTGEDVYNLTVPLIVTEKGWFEYLNYTASPGLRVLGSDFNHETGYLVVLINGRGTFEALFHVRDLFEEELPMTYTVSLDTTTLRNIASDITVELIIAGVYDVSRVVIYGKADVSTSIEGDVTRVLISGFAWLELVFRLELEPALETAPVVPTQAQYNQPALIIAVSAATTIAVAVALFYVLRFKRTRLSLEYIEPHKDPALRLIIKALGEAGEQGLTQSDLARRTGLPKSSVSRKIRRLQNEGLVEVKTVGKYNYVLLTPKGLSMYRKIMSEESSKR